MSELLQRCLDGGVAFDSRQVEPGQIFFALEGERTDGHDHLGEVAERGAACAVVRNGYTGSPGIELLRVEDPLEQLQAIARERLADIGAKVVAVTGSLGKTTVKHFLGALLGAQYRTYASPGNHNTQVTLPLSILKAPADTQAMVLEMGMTGPGQIANLVKIAPPTVAVLSKIAFVHSEFFESLEAIKRAKLEIFSHPDTRMAIVPHDLEASVQPLQRSFSVSSSAADLWLKREGEQLHLFEGGAEQAVVEWKLPGVHNPYNYLAAVAAARAMGVDWKAIERVTPELTLPAMRFEMHERDGVTLINDAYNAAAPSVCSALDSLPQPKKGGRRIAVLSEMLELGKFSREAHQKVGEHALDCLDHLVCIGAGCSPIKDIWDKAGRKVDWFGRREGVLEHVRSLAQEGDVILFKGGRLYALEKLCEAF